MNDANADANAYAPPTTDVRQSMTPGGDDALKRLSTKEVKKLFNHSRSVGALVFLWSLGVVVTAAILIPNFLAGVKQAGGQTGDGMVTVFLGIFGAVMVLQVAGVYGCWVRASWARTVGIILCVLMLLNFPLGTLIGIFGLIALISGGRLFGPERLTHQQLKAEVAYRKANNLR